MSLTLKDPSDLLYFHPNNSAAFILFFIENVHKTGVSVFSDFPTPHLCVALSPSPLVPTENVYL